MTLLDQIVLLITGLTTVYLIFRFYKDYGKDKYKTSYNFLYITSFAILFVSCILLILSGWNLFGDKWANWNLLQHAFVATAAILIPLCLSVGLMIEYHKKKSKKYIIFAIIALLLIILTRYEFFTNNVVKVVIYAGIHSIAGLLIFFIPIFAIKNNSAPKGFYFVTVGGALIGIAGIALAILKSGSQFLFFSREFVLAILAPLLLLMTLAYIWGFVEKIKNKRFSNYG